MRAILSLLMGFVAIGLIGGCAAISKEECEVGDWASIGQKDGRRGKEKKVYYKYVEKCGEYGVEPNKKDYDMGFSEGVKEYCTPENGWNVGKNGTRYNNVCPKKLSRAFLTAYNQGKKVYKINQEISNLERKIQDIDAQIDTKESSMVERGKSGAEVLMSGVQLDKLRRERHKHEKKIDRLRAKADKMDSFN